jgi:putative tricarboxylic transport membrane protein
MTPRRVKIKVDGREEIRLADRVIFVCTLLLAGVYLYATEQLPSLEIGDPLGPKAFPRLLSIGLVVTAVVLLLEIVRARKRPATAPAVSASAPTPHEQSDRHAYAVVSLVTVWTFLYFLAFEPLGYVVATSLYLFVLMAYFNRGKWLANVLTAVLFCAGSYYMFTALLGVTLPHGVLPF